MKALLFAGGWDPAAITALVTAVLGFFAGLIRGRRPKPTKPHDAPKQPKP